MMGTLVVKGLQFSESKICSFIHLPSMFCSGQNFIMDILFQSYDHKWQWYFIKLIEFHSHQLFHRHCSFTFLKYISSNINTSSSEITPWDFKDLAHFTASSYTSVIFFSFETRMEILTLSLVIGVFLNIRQKKWISNSIRQNILFFFLEFELFELSSIEPRFSSDMI